MKTLAEMRSQLAAGDFDLTAHALDRIVVRNISQREIQEAGANAVRIEDYPADKYSPSCLLFGFTKAGRPLHLQVSCAGPARAKVITVYEPDPQEWIDYARRR